MVHKLMSSEYMFELRETGLNKSRHLVIFCLAFICVVGVTRWELVFHYAEAVLSLASL